MNGQLLCLLFAFLVLIASYYYVQSTHQNGLIIASYKNIPVLIVSNVHSLEVAINKLLAFNPLYLGIDCEWRPNRKGEENKVALVQIAHESMIILIRLNKIEFISSGLLSLLSNANILKCGVGINGDQKKLFRDYNVNILGIVELNHLYRRYNDYDGNHSFFGLKKMSKMILNIEMQKSVTLSDWGTSDDLSQKQIIYAAEDAFVSFQIFDKLIKQQMDEQSILNIDTLQNICFGIIDAANFKTNKSKKKQRHKKCSKSSKKSSYEKAREGRFYDNCKILKPNGDFLSWCRKKTLARYINKGYAVKVDEDM